MRFMMSSCNRHWYCAHSRATKQPWPSHYSAACRDCVAKHQRTTEPESWRNGCEAVIYEASLKKWNKWKMRKRSFRATLPSKCESGPCKKRSFRARLLSKIWKWKTWKQSFRRDFLQKRGNFKLTKRRLKRQLHCETSVKLKVSHAIALTCHCFDIPLLWFK